MLGDVVKGEAKGGKRKMKVKARGDAKDEQLSLDLQGFLVDQYSHCSRALEYHCQWTAVSGCSVGRVERNRCKHGHKVGGSRRFRVKLCEL